MRIIREYENESPIRICHFLRVSPYQSEGLKDDIVVGIDEEFLAWFYVAPSAELSQRSLEMLNLARELIGCGAWAVLQTQGDTDQELLSDIGLRVVESYEDESGDPRSVSVHVVQTVSGVQSCV
jgi:hypothetical protein